MMLSVAALVAAGCASGSPGPAASGDAGAGDPARVLAEARASTASALQGTDRSVDATARPIVKGKKVAIIVTSMVVDSSKVPALGAEEAAKAAGWSATIYDAQLAPARFPDLVRQAVAAGADGIILTTVDCKNAKQPLAEAKAKGVAITAIYAFDCDDPRADPANVSEPLFSVNTNFGPEGTDLVKFTKQYGADQANYVIANSDNKAKIIVINSPEFTVLNYTTDGFKERIEQSGGSEVVATLDATAADIANQQLQPKIQAELLKHPEATWVKSPFTFVTTLGIAPALGSRAGQIKVMGGEGFPGELDLMRQGKVTAANVISSTWTGWAAVDSLNSYWHNQKPVDSGIGYTLVDKDHGLPASGPVEPSVDFRAAYKKAWGVS